MNMNNAPPTAKEKVKALDLALQQIEKQFGKGAIMKLGEESSKTGIDVIPTGSIGLDMALGVGGVPRGRIVEIYGPESSGKTTLALTIISNAQRAGGNAVMIDAEHALDAAYAQKLGVDIANLHVAQPDTGEEALEIADHLVRSGAVDVVVIDSVAALVPRAEIEGEMGDSHVGLQARLMSQALRKLTGSISKSRTTVIFINQIRMQIGVMFGNPETTAGGRALKFYASVRLDIRRIQTLKEGEQAIGNRTKVKVVKNKVAAPFREAEFDILYNEGISREGEIIDFAVDKGIIQRNGTWFSFGEERIGQGRENARLFIKEHADIRAQIEAKLLPALGLKTLGATANGAATKSGADEAPVANIAPAKTEAGPAQGVRPIASGPIKPPNGPTRPQPALVAKDGKR
jgi:recombination protein RecA